MWSLTDEIQQASQRAWFPLDLDCCASCHDLATEAKRAADVVHDAWLDTWGPFVRRPPSEVEVEESFLEFIHPSFKNDRETWVDDYKRLALAFAITNGTDEVNAVYDAWATTRAHQDTKGTIYFRYLLWLATELSSEVGLDDVE